MRYIDSATKFDLNFYGTLLVKIGKFTKITA